MDDLAAWAGSAAISQSNISAVPSFNDPRAYRIAPSGARLRAAHAVLRLLKGDEIEIDIGT